MKLKLHWQVLIAMFLGLVFALIFKERALIAAPLGTLFMRLLKMGIVPLILFSITSGVASLGDSRTLGRMGAKTFAYYFLTSMLAILLGLTLTNLIKPGIGVDIGQMGQLFDSTTLVKPNSLGDILTRMIPLNPLKAAAEGEILSIIFWSILFGFSITRLEGKSQEVLSDFFDAGFKGFFR